MMSECCNEKTTCDCEPVGLADVSNMSIRDLQKVDPDSALGRSIRRMVRNLHDPNGVISAFSNFVD